MARGGHNQINVYGKTIGEVLLLNSHVDENGCRVWHGAVSGTAGDYYGTFRWQGKVIRAHVAAWENKHGKIPKEKEPHHKCENKLCIETKHIDLLTHVEHMQLHHVHAFDGTCRRGHSLKEFGYKKRDARTIRGYSILCKECKGMGKRQKREWLKEHQDITRIAKG